MTTPPSTDAALHWLDAQLNVYNVERMLAREPERYEFVRFDPNNTCNVQCVYCHNHRSAETVATAQLHAFLDRVLAVRNFQMGCIMEPTLDSRMADLLLAVRGSRAAPIHELVLQTNGILLHMHDPGKLSAAGLTRLAVSIDSADPDIQRSLRGGTSLGKVERNLRAFVAACPRVPVHFITTVTRLNIDSLEGLVTFGLDIGVAMFVLREVFYHPELDVPIDRERMPDLVLRPGDYAGMAARLSETFQGRASFEFADSVRLATGESKMIVDSLRQGE